MPLSRPPTPIRTRTEKSAAGVGLAVEVDIYLEPVTKPSTDSQRPTIRQYRFFRPGGLFTVLPSIRTAPPQSATKKTPPLRSSFDRVLSVIRPESRTALEVVTNGRARTKAP